MNVYFLFAIFGLAMLIQHSIVRNWLCSIKWVWATAFFVALFQCALCMGFHAGWLCYLLLVDGPINIRHLIFWALVGAGFTQLVKDVTTRIVGDPLDKG